jgi:hypothetical protein
MPHIKTYPRVTCGSGPCLQAPAISLSGLIHEQRILVAIEMTKEDIDELLIESRFSPFIITMTDGFSIAVGEEARKHITVGRHLMVMLDARGDLVHIPYRSIAHIQEPSP